LLEVCRRLAYQRRSPSRHRSNIRRPPVTPRHSSWVDHVLIFLGKVNPFWPTDHRGRLSPWSLWGRSRYVLSICVTSARAARYATETVPSLIHGPWFCLGPKRSGATRPSRVRTAAVKVGCPGSCPRFEPSAQGLGDLTAALGGLGANFPNLPKRVVGVGHSWATLVTLMRPAYGLILLAFRCGRLGLYVDYPPLVSSNRPLAPLEHAFVYAGRPLGDRVSLHKQIAAFVCQDLACTGTQRYGC
jgi:hypothetical protein